MEMEINGSFETIGETLGDIVKDLAEIVDFSNILNEKDEGSGDYLYDTFYDLTGHLSELFRHQLIDAVNAQIAYNTCKYLKEEMAKSGKEEEQ